GIVTARPPAETPSARILGALPHPVTRARGANIGRSTGTSIGGARPRGSLPLNVSRCARGDLIEARERGIPLPNGAECHPRAPCRSPLVRFRRASENAG